MHRTIVGALLAIMFSIPAVYAAEVRYFEVPKGDRPHDVAPSPDGSVWYTSQRTGNLGRLDPKTGTVERIPLGSGSSPHGVIM
jgi:virginiamycin B lyase